MRKKLSKFKPFLLMLGLTSAPLLAQESSETDTPEVDKTSEETKPEASEAELKATQKASDDEEHSVMPLWGDDARARGYTLPRPYGFSLSYIKIQSVAEINKIELAGGAKGGIDSLDIGTSNADFIGTNVTARLDMWLFPFLSVYGILGVTHGESEATITKFDCNRTTVAIGFKAFCTALQNNNDAIIGAPFAVELDGITYGGGMTLAGGAGNWFAIVDVNMSQTQMQSIGGTVNAQVAAPRAGYIFNVGENSQIRPYIGAFYQDADQTVDGTLAELNLPDVLHDLIIEIAPNATFAVEQEGAVKWNGVIGANFSINRRWDITTEWGYGKRHHGFISAAYRWGN